MRNAFYAVVRESDEMNRCCVCGKNYIVFSTGTVWNRKTQRHEDAGFCGYGCLDIAEDTLKPHIVKRKNGGNMDEHSHDSVYCFGVKGQRKKRRLATMIEGKCK